jgi:hypothetical protein
VQLVEPQQSPKISELRVDWPAERQLQSLVKGLLDPAREAEPHQRRIKSDIEIFALKLLVVQSGSGVLRLRREQCIRVSECESGTEREERSE